MRLGLGLLLLARHRAQEVTHLLALLLAAKVSAELSHEGGGGKAMKMGGRERGNQSQSLRSSMYGVIHS